MHEWLQPHTPKELRNSTELFCSALAQKLVPAWRHGLPLHRMNGGEDFVGFANEVQAIFSAASGINLQQQIRIGTLQLFQGHTCLGLVFEMNEWTSVECR